MTTPAQLRALIASTQARRRVSGRNPVHQRDPVAWAADVLKVPSHTLVWSENAGYDTHVWDGTRDPIAAMLRAVAAGVDVGVESGTGTGKTFGLAIVALWFLDTFDHSLVVSLAPKADQLRLHMWKEVGTFWPAFKAKRPDAELLDLEARIKPGEGTNQGWTGIGFPVGVEADAKVAQKARGFHREHMLFIFEEATGIHNAIYEAVENTCTATHNLRLAVGNPDAQTDPLHQFCMQPGVQHIRASVLDHPNIVTGRDIIPAAQSRRTVERRRLRYGEDGRLYLSRVRGISPPEASDALIKMAWVRAAQARWADPAEAARLRTLGAPALGVDVAASESGDEAAIARGQGAYLDEVPSFPNASTTMLARRVADLMKAHQVDAQHVGVDIVGVGAGTVNTLQDLGHAVEGLNGGLTDAEVLAGKYVFGMDAERFLNLRAAMHWALRTDLEHGRIALPPDEELAMDLVTPKWETRSGKIVVQPKEDIIAELGRSPNKSDAVVYWNWVRARPPAPDPEPAPFPTRDAAVSAHRRKLMDRLRRRLEQDPDTVQPDEEAVLGPGDDVVGDVWG